MGCAASSSADGVAERSGGGGGGRGSDEQALMLTEDLAGAWVPTRQDLWSLSVETWGERLLPNVMEVFEGGQEGSENSLIEVLKDGSCQCTFGKYCSTSGQWYKAGSRYVCFTQVKDCIDKTFVGTEAEVEAKIIPSSELSVKVLVTLTSGPVAGRKRFPMCYKRVQGRMAPAVGQPVVKSL